MKPLFLIASGTLAVVPGLMTLQSGIGVPPGTKVLFGGGVEAFGALALLLVWANRERLSAMKTATATVLAVSLACFCLLCLVTYTSLLAVCVVETTKPEHKAYGPVFFPLSLDGQIADLVAKKKSRVAVLNEFGPGAIADMMHEMPGIASAFVVTKVVLFLLYQAVFTSLVLTFGLLGVQANRQPASQVPSGVGGFPSKKPATANDLSL
jgi:hypothetical protein